MSQLVLMVGHVGAGKTTRARELAATMGAVRLTPDEWMGPLFRDSDAEGMRDVVEGRLIWTAVQVLRAGAPAILDFGFWGREERAALHWLAGTLGARARTEWLPIDRALQSQRVQRRWREHPERTWPITQQDLDRWRVLLEEPDAAELTGASFAAEPHKGWEAWIARRWPTALGS